jgi:magnesium transporter
MRRFLRKRTRKVGLSPGTLVHIGEKKAERTTITLLDYDERHLEEHEISTADQCLSFAGKPTVTWINVEGLHEVESIGQLGDAFGLHPLIVEDILNTDQRPKMEDLNEYVYIVLKMLNYNGASHEVMAEQVSLILGPSFVITFQEQAGDVFDPIRERIKRGRGRIRQMGADYLAYALLDTVVDNYFLILEVLGERIESLEEELVSNPATQTLHEIHRLKREMVFLRKAVWPLRETIGSLERGESPLFQETTNVYLRDVYDHTIQVMDTIETFRDILSTMLDIYLSGISNRMNAVMQVLTVIATIFIPLTFIAGLYGMNFRYMPELEWRWGYPAVLFVMVVISVLMLIYFKKRDWL